MALRDMDKYERREFNAYKRELAKYKSRIVIVEGDYAGKRGTIISTYLDFDLRYYNVRLDDGRVVRVYNGEWNWEK